MKDEILVCAERMFKKHGYDKTTFQMIADELKITKGAISYHFKFKWGIFDELFSGYIKSLHWYIKENLKSNYNSYLHYCIVAIDYFVIPVYDHGGKRVCIENHVIPCG